MASGLVILIKHSSSIFSTSSSPCSSSCFSAGSSSRRRRSCAWTTWTSTVASGSVSPFALLRLLLRAPGVDTHSMHSRRHGGGGAGPIQAAHDLVREVVGLPRLEWKRRGLRLRSSRQLQPPSTLLLLSCVSVQRLLFSLEVLISVRTT
jgi:hypothetical protein